MIRGVLVACIVVVLTVGATLAEPLPRYHNLNSPDHWYDHDCCNTLDCRPAVEGEVKFRDGGVEYVPAKQFMPWGDKKLRPSQDANTHICPYQMYTGNGKVLRTRCIYYAIGG